MSSLNLAYITISVDDTRDGTREGLDESMNRLGIPKIEGVTFVDGRIPGEIEKHLEINSLPTPPSGFRLGELGVWMSNYYCWKAIAESSFDGVIVFEDDAVVHDETFDEIMKRTMDDLPHDYDAFSLAPTQKILYNPSIHGIGSDVVCKSYQRYGCVATMYSPGGARKLAEFVEANGFQYPVDSFIFEERGLTLKLNTCSPTPFVPEFVTFIEQGTSIHNTERVGFDEQA